MKLRKLLLGLIISLLFILVGCEKKQEDSTTYNVPEHLVKEFDCRMIKDNLICACKNRKYGFITLNGETKIDFVYDRAYPFNDGTAIIKLSEYYYLIDKNGTKMTKGYDDIKYASHNDFSILVCKLNGRYGLIDNKGNILVDCVYDDLGEVSSNNVLFAVVNNLYGIINTEGQKIVDFKYLYIDNFSDGLAVAMDTNNKYGYIDEKGQEKIGFVFDTAERFNNGIAIVSKATEYSVIASNGNLVHSFNNNAKTCANIAGLIYEDGLIFNKLGEKIFTLPTNQSIVYEKCIDFSSVYKNDKSVFILITNDEKTNNSVLYIFGDKSCIFLSNLNDLGIQEFENADIFYEYNREMVYLDISDESDRHKIIKLSTNMVELGASFEGHSCMSKFASDGIYVAYNKNMRYGLVDVNGNVILDFLYDLLYCISSDGYVVYNIGKNSGIKDLSGKTIIENEYDFFVNDYSSVIN